MSEEVTAIKVGLPVQDIGVAARGAALVTIELLGLKASAIVKHPDFVDGATIETVLSTAIATVAKVWFGEGARAGSKATVVALGGALVEAVDGGVHGNASV